MADVAETHEVAMSEADRAQYLIKYCCGGSATDFAASLGIDKTRMSRIVHGKMRLSGLFDVIIKTYPEVNPQWLRTGLGYPGDITPELLKARYERIIAEKDSLIRALTKIIETKL